MATFAAAQCESGAANALGVGIVRFSTESHLPGLVSLHFFPVLEWAATASAKAEAAFERTRLRLGSASALLATGHGSRGDRRGDLDGLNGARSDDNDRCYCDR